MLIRIDPSTGGGTLIGSTGTQIPDITIGPDGILRGWSECSAGCATFDDPIVIEKSTGAVIVTPSTLVTANTGVASESLTSIYVKIRSSDFSSSDLYLVDVNTGEGTFLFNLGVFTSNILENAPDGTLLTGNRDGTGTQFYRIDVNSGITTPLGHAAVEFSGIAFLPDADGDGDDDGIPDADDECLNSNLSPTVVIDGCNSGVSNTVFANGCTISDRIAECAEGASSHGQFTRCVSQLTDDLKTAGVITGKQKDKIQRCAANADIP